MALTPEEIKKVNQEFNDLIVQLDEVEQRSLTQVREDLENGRKTLEQWNNEVKRFKITLDSVSDNLSFASVAFKNIVADLKAGTNLAKLQKENDKSRVASLNKISSIATRALEVRRGDASLSDKELDNLRLRNQREEENLKRLRDLAPVGSERRKQLNSELNETRKVGKSIGIIKDRQQEVNKELGFAPSLAAGLDRALQKAGLPALGISDALAETQKEAQRVAAEGGKAKDEFNALSFFTAKVGENLAEAASITNVLQLGFGLVLKSVFDLNKEQTEFRRLVGESADGVGLLNSGLLTSVDLIKTQVALSEQFGLNARAAFSQETIQEAGELTKAVGLTAEESGNFAKFSAITGTNLNNQLDSLTKSIPKAFNQRQILQQTANVTSDIALAFDNQVELIGDAVVKAKQLGLTLGDVNQIADSLLDIESSLAAEFEAEVITGKSLNFERARFFALTNDLAGLTDEIKNNEEIINEFAGATRIEQESIAKAFGMSRQQMADMVMSSKLINTLSDEQRANAAGVSIEQLKQLDIQQSLSDSINKLTQALAGPLEKFASLVQFAVKFSDALLFGVGVFTILNNKAAISAAFAKKNLMVGIADMAIGAYRSLVAIPFAGPVLAAAGAAVAFALGKSYLQKAGDAIIPVSGGPTISTREGGLIQGTVNDDIIMAPGIAGGSLRTETRSTPGTVVLSDSQIQKIANAVRDGASRATINLDGDRVSSRLQTPTVLNTLPGV